MSIFYRATSAQPIDSESSGRPAMLLTLKRGVSGRILTAYEAFPEEITVECDSIEATAILVRDAAIFTVTESSITALNPTIG